MLTPAPRPELGSWGGVTLRAKPDSAGAAVSGPPQAGNTLPPRRAQAQLGVDSFAGYFFSKLTNVADGTAPLDVQYS